MDFLPHLTIILLASLTRIVHTQRYDCSRVEFDRCIKVADPLLRDPSLVFPDNRDDIDLVCRTWNRFVDCLKKYTDDCFTEQQRKQFNKAVEHPIESVHQMCTQPVYQQEYLRHAPCLKGIIMDRRHCRPHYDLLVEQVAQGDIISKATLCCSHDRFKQCVQRETRKVCDRGQHDGGAEGPAEKFSLQIIDKALSFLQDQCFNYIPNSGDCITIATDAVPFSDPVMISTAPSEVYPWSTIQENNIGAKEVPPAHMTPPKISSTWMPSSSGTSLDSFEGTYQTDSTQILGSRTRPASYGRSSSWSETPEPSVQTKTSSYGTNNVPVYTNEQRTSTTNKPAWATISTWSQFPGSTLQGGRSSIATETWYPAAGNQLSNEVDEPNQQGLSYKRDNGAVSISITITLLMLPLLLVGL